MDQIKKKFLIIDWGFTRFKLWLLDNRKNILKKKFIDTNQISSQPEFYQESDLYKIASSIKDFIKDQISNNEIIYIYNSCQMHGIAGLMKGNIPFFSTWNDLPSSILDYKSDSINGNPFLISMPINKIFLNEKKYYLKTKFISKFLNKEKIEIIKFMTPFQLIYNYFLGFNLPPSKYLWDTTCMPEKLLNKENNQEYTDYNSLIKTNKINLFNKPFKVKVYPEMGDLQASTYSSIKRSDIVINLGTGSQIVFKKLNNFIENKFYRHYPGIGNLPVISHIPCGRLFAEYCTNSKFSFEDINKELEKLDFESFKKIVISHKKKLLFFPGYDFVSFEYKNNPEVNIKEIIKYSPQILICNWLNQYIDLISNFANPAIKSKIKVNISGELGGITEKTIKIFKYSLPKNYQFEMTNFQIPQSIMECVENIS